MADSKTITRVVMDRPSCLIEDALQDGTSTERQLALWITAVENPPMPNAAQKFGYVIGVILFVLACLMCLALAGLLTWGIWSLFLKVIA